MKSNIEKIKTDGGKITAAMGKLGDDLKKAKTDADVQAVMGKDEHKDAIAQMKVLERTSLSDSDIDEDRVDEKKIRARLKAYETVTGNEAAAKKLTERDIDAATANYGSGKQTRARAKAKEVLTAPAQPAPPSPVT